MSSALRRNKGGDREQDLLKNWSGIKEQAAAAQAATATKTSKGRRKSSNDGETTFDPKARGYMYQKDRDKNYLRVANFCMVIIFHSKEYTTEFMLEVKEKLVAHGLEVAEREYAASADQKNLIVGMTDRSMEGMAQQLQFQLKLSPVKGDPLKVRYAPFKISEKGKFEVEEELGDSIFLPCERLRLVHKVLKTALGEDYYDRKKFSKIFPLHDHEQNSVISKKFYKCCGKTPIHDIRAYYGERIALYFTFLQFYTKFLALSAGVGFIFQVVGIAYSITQFTVPSIPDLRFVLEPLYTFFLMIWGTVYLNYWRQRRSVVTFQWNTFTMKESKDFRHEFKGEWKVDEITGQKVLRYPLWKRIVGRYSFSWTVAISLIISVVAFIISVIIFKAWSPFPFASLIGGFTNGVVIFFTNRVYRNVATRMTNFENHKTDQDWENSFIVKTFMFQFVNSYTQLYYIAFLKGKLRRFGIPDVPCADPNDCYPEVERQLFSQFLGQLVVGQCIEVLLPYLKYKINIWKMKAKSAKIHRVKATESEDVLIETQGTMEEYDIFDDYGELIIQFGYVTLFASAFPLAPVFAYFNNLIEIRSDFWKMSKFCRRPIPQQQSIIGTWYHMLVILSFISVATNIGMLAFSSATIHAFVRKNPFPASWGMGPLSTKVFYFFLLEHIFIGLKIALGFFIGDVHPWVAEQMKVHAREQKERTLASIQDNLLAKEKELLDDSPPEKGKKQKAKR